MDSKQSGRRGCGGDKYRRLSTGLAVKSSGANFLGGGESGEGIFRWRVYTRLDAVRKIKGRWVGQERERRERRGSNVRSRWTWGGSGRWREAQLQPGVEAHP